jgi:hypothetical protein
MQTKVIKFFVDFTTFLISDQLEKMYKESELSQFVPVESKNDKLTKVFSISNQRKKFHFALPVPLTVWMQSFCNFL